MANLTAGGGDPDVTPSQQNQSILQNNYQDYVSAGGNPSSYTISPGLTFSSGPATSPTNPYSLLGGYAGGGGGGGYAPYAVGGGHTRWDEFVQQMQLEQDKIKQANEQLAQQKALEEERLAQEKAIANQNTVESFDKDLMGMKGPADPYGYLFASRGMAAPQGYTPTAMPLADAVQQQYKSQGIDLADAQKQLVGSSGPSFIQGYLGGMSPSLQQGAMGFQNTPQFKDVAPGSQPQGSQPSSQPSSTPMATGGVVPGFSPGHDTVPAMLSPGEGVLKPQVVQELGGPNAINALNAQHFAQGGTVVPQQFDQLTDLGNGLYQRGTETATTRDPAGQDLTPPASWWPLPGGGGVGLPVWTSQGSAAAPVARTGFDQSGVQVTGPRGSSGVPVNIGGTAGYMNPGDITSYSMPVVGSKQSLSPDLPVGYELQAPGVAARNGASPDWVRSVESYFGAGTGASGGLRGDSFQGPAWHPTAPIGTSGPTSDPSLANSSSPLLTGGTLQAPAPPTGPPMNLNLLDPYTRSLVDQYGRPQTPSAQALANMPQSGQQAYQNYVEKVAGGNYQDLLDQSKMMNPSGANPGDFKFS